MYKRQGRCRADRVIGARCRHHRTQRAELRSPGRLAEEAAKLGMVPATQTEFVSLDADDVATVQRLSLIHI